MHWAITLTQVDDDLVSQSPGALFLGAHFLDWHNLHETLICRLREVINQGNISNNEHPDAEVYLHRMVFQGLRDHIKFTSTVTEDSLYEGNANLEFSSQYPYLGVASLLYMAMCPEAFDIHSKRVWPVARLPDTFYKERWNARIGAAEWRQRIRQQGGPLWDIIRMVERETDDRWIHGDDIGSHCRLLTAEAQEWGDTAFEVPATIYDPRFRKQRAAFYAKTVHATADAPQYPGKGATELFAWSNLAEGTISFDWQTGVAYYPGAYQINWPRPVDVMSPLRGIYLQDSPTSKGKRRSARTQEPTLGPTPAPISQTISWTEQHVDYVEEEAARRGKALGVDNWWTCLEGGAIDSTTGWIGRIIQPAPLVGHMESGSNATEDEEMVDVGVA